VEITIGVQHVSRELTLETDKSADDVQATVNKAVDDGGTLVLEDEKGRQVVVPVSSLAYVEIGSGEQRRIGIV